MSTNELADVLGERILSAPGCGPEVQQSLDRQSDDDLILSHIPAHIGLDTAKQLAAGADDILDWFDSLNQYRGSGVN
jgi:hypothetical protein